MHQTMTLEIRHQILVDTETGKYVLREIFGACKPQEFLLNTLDEAKALAAKRQLMLKELVASIGDDARRAVEDARHIDNLKAGNA